MEPWSYVERKRTKLLFWIIFVFGELSLLGVLAFSFSQRAEGISSLAIPVSLVAFLLWSGIFQYFFSNSPRRITVYREGILVTFSEKRAQLFPWENVFLKRVGLSPIPLIFIKNKKTSALLNVPKIVFLDGSSKGYKGLIERISMQSI